MRRWSASFGIPLVSLLLLPHSLAQVGGEVQEPVVLVEFVAPPGQTLARISAGAPGSGTILYYLASRSPAEPTLVVQLSNDGEGSATAEVYAPPEGSEIVPATVSEDSVTVDPAIFPSMIFEALGGWWVRRGKTNYNLNIRVFGGIRATWGVELTEADLARISPDRTMVTVRVRDPFSTGLPVWDFRVLEPAFLKRGYYRGNYAERKCDTPLEIDSGLTPDWPFVATDAPINSYLQQEVGRWRAPIAVDWSTGVITSLSEMVSVRNQNCSYSFYSISRVAGNTLNDANYETPFAFYDLSGEGRGMPNLIIRTERFPAKDEYSINVYLPSEPDLEGTRPVPRDTNILRYSWRNQVGDGRWDYTFQILGFHPYDFETPVAGGGVRITAPSYEAYPEWVIDNEWAIVNFIDTEGNSYRSSEGIYDWNAAGIELGYAFGWRTDRNVDNYARIREGFRGEYRFRRKGGTLLYLSPIDNRLHLQGAEGGLWNLDGDLWLRLANLDDDPYLDSWELLRREPASNQGPLRPPGAGLEETRVARLVDLGGYLLYFEGDTLLLKEYSLEPSLFEIEPPVDDKSWREFRIQTEPYEALRRDPLAIDQWPVALEGPSLTVAGLTVADFQMTASAAHLVVDVAPGGVAIQGDLGVGPFAALEAGRFVVVFDRIRDEWSLLPATPPDIAVRLEAEGLRRLRPSQVVLELENRGTSDFEGEVVLRIGSQVVEWDGTVVPGRGSVRKTAVLNPERSGTREAGVRVGDQQFDLGAVEVAEVIRVDSTRAVQLSAGRASVQVLIGVLILLFTAGTLVVSRIWLRT